MDRGAWCRSQSTESQSVGHDWATSLHSLHTFSLEKEKATHSNIPAWKSHGWRSLVGCSSGAAKSQTWLSDFPFTFHFHALEKEMATTPVSCIKPGLATHFIHDIIHVSMTFSQISTPSPSPTESIRLIYTSVSLMLSCTQGYCYHLSKFHIYALVYCIGVFLSGLLHSV